MGLDLGDLTCEERPSDSPLVQEIWTSRSDRAGAFISMAEIHCGMVATKIEGRMILTVRGPETRATAAYCPADAEWVGIMFKPGVYLPAFPAKRIMDRQDVNLPEASGRSFWLGGSAWHYPDFDNADCFVDRLVRAGLLAYDPVAAAVLRAEPAGVSERTVQRRFLQATGMTQAEARQIERARYAVALLKQGWSVIDTVNQAGYSDQPHLTRSLKRFTGLTPAQIADKDRKISLSLLYKEARRATENP